MTMMVEGFFGKGLKFSILGCFGYAKQSEEWR